MWAGAASARATSLGTVQGAPLAPQGTNGHVAPIKAVFVSRIFAPRQTTAKIDEESVPSWPLVPSGAKREEDRARYPWRESRATQISSAGHFHAQSGVT